MNKKIIIALSSAVLAIASTSYAYVETGVDNGINYEMKYPLVYTDNQSAQDKINQDIYQYIASVKPRSYL